MIEFVSYTGRYPNLCRGILTIKVYGKLYELTNVLCSGGSVWFDDGWCEHVEDGEWAINKSNLPEELEQYIEEIEYVVNENIEYGCCGGCV